MLKIDEVQPGMILDKDVANLQGAVLLRKGSEITERHISIFKTWGVNTIFIQEAVSADALGGKSPQEAAKEEIETVTKTLDHKYALVIDEPVMQTIKGISLAYRTDTIKRKYNVT